MPDSYIYGDFLLTVMGAPVSIALGWGVIIYTSMVTAERLGVARKIRPYLVALLALNIDLSMDIIAIREGFWSWSLNGYWYGVPAGNLVGWFIVAFSFSYFIYYFRENQKLKLIYPIICMILSLIILTIIELIEIYFLWPIIIEYMPYFVVVVFILGFSLIYVLLNKGQLKKDNEFDWIVVSIPACFHGLFLTLLLIGDYKTPSHILISLSMLIVGIYVYLLPYLDTIRKKFRTKFS